MYSKKFLRFIFEDAEDPMASKMEISNVDAQDLLKEPEPDLLKEPVDSNQPDLSKDIKRSGTTYGFPINSNHLKDINTLIERGEGEWNSNEPLKQFKDGKAGEAATLANKPVYLKIKISRSKIDRTSQPVELELADRVYVLLDTSAEYLKPAIERAKDITSSVRVPVKTPLLSKGNTVEHSLEFWRDENQESDPMAPSKGTGESTQNVKIDWAQQLAAPGTSAGIGESKKTSETGSINESNEYRWLKFIK
jgi:hypothetical protein